MTKAEQVNSELMDSYLCNCEGDCECDGYPTDCRMMEAWNSAEKSAVLRLEIGDTEYVVYDDGSYLDCEGDCERGYPTGLLSEDFIRKPKNYDKEKEKADLLSGIASLKKSLVDYESKLAALENKQ